MKIQEKNTMEKRPNILFITVDHLRYDTLGHTGDPVIQTPRLRPIHRETSRNRGEGYPLPAW